MDMSALWMHMIELYGRRWTHQFGEIPPPGTVSPTMRSWAAGLRGKSAVQLRAGLRKCVEGGKEWPPSLPEFHAHCRVTLADLKLPEPPLALEQSTHRRTADQHPAVRATVNALSGVERPVWHSLTQREAAFLRVYRLMCRRVMAGESLELPVPRQVIHPHPVDPPATADEARAWLDTLRRTIAAPARHPVNAAAPAPPVEAG